MQNKIGQVFNGIIIIVFAIQCLFFELNSEVLKIYCIFSIMPMLFMLTKEPYKFKLIIFLSWIFLVIYSNILQFIEIPVVYLFWALLSLGYSVFILYYFVITYFYKNDNRIKQKESK